MQALNGIYIEIPDELIPHELRERNIYSDYEWIKTIQESKQYDNPNWKTYSPLSGMSEKGGAKERV